jgi:hypothetical protein
MRSNLDTRSTARSRDIDNDVWIDTWRTHRRERQSSFH